MKGHLASQQFLGPDSDLILLSLTVGIVGLSGGGSHYVQQLAHAGVGSFVPVDFDIVTKRNLNRLVGATAEDVRARRAKTKIAERVIRCINPDATVTPCRCRWQEALPALRRCDVICGCVDSFRERDELERFARRFLIPYIDVGMDVHGDPGRYTAGGQVVLSAPGGPCLWCLGILTRERIAQEARRYGKAGSRPQVVWINGVLASLGVGLLMQLACPWHGAPQISACCEFDANRHRVETSRLDHAEGLCCSHFRADELGDAFFGRGG